MLQIGCAPKRYSSVEKIMPQAWIFVCLPAGFENQRPRPALSRNQGRLGSAAIRIGSACHSPVFWNIG